MKKLHCRYCGVDRSYGTMVVIHNIISIVVGSVSAMGLYFLLKKYTYKNAFGAGLLGDLGRTAAVKIPQYIQKLNLHLFFTKRKTFI